MHILWMCIKLHFTSFDKRKALAWLLSHWFTPVDSLTYCFRWWYFFKYAIRRRWVLHIDEHYYLCFDFLLKEDLCHKYFQILWRYYYTQMVIIWFKMCTLVSDNNNKQNHKALRWTLFSDIRRLQVLEKKSFYRLLNC